MGQDVDNIKRVVTDIRYLIATDCCDETIQARIKNFINEKLGQTYPLLSVINWVAVSDSLPDHLQKVVMYGKRTEHNEPEIITGVLNRAGGLNQWNTYGIIMHEVTQWAVIEPPCL